MSTNRDKCGSCCPLYTTFLVVLSMFTSLYKQDMVYTHKYGIPLECEGDACIYYVAVGPNADNADYLDVHLRGTASGWIAIGFSQDQLMVCNYSIISCSANRA